MNKEQRMFKKVIRDRIRHRGRVKMLKDYIINRLRGGNQVLQKKNI